MTQPKEILTALPADWVSLDTIIVEVMHRLGDEITKRNVAKVARMAGIEIKRLPIVVRSAGTRGPRQRSELVMCIHRDNLPCLIAEIEDRLKHDTTLFDAAQNSPDPTPAEIRRMCEQIRANRRRRGADEIAEQDHKPVETPQLHVEFKRGQVYSIG